MSSLWFCVPAHGRYELTRVCLMQLRATCDALTADHIEATAVVVADDENLDTARELSFATIRRGNAFLSKKFNDGIQLACDPRHNKRPADYVVPCGSDDWIDHRILLDLPPHETMLAFTRAAFVSEDGSAIISRVINTRAGVGIRVYPRQLMQRCSYRPADEDRNRACDMSILVNLARTFPSGGPPIIYGDRHDFQIVDWKSHGTQLNGFADMARMFRRGTASADPFATLAGTYPAGSLDAMRAVYAARQLVAA